MDAQVDGFSETVGNIYEAGLDPDKWPFALQSLCQELDADKAQMLYLDPNGYMISFACGYGFDPFEHDIGAGRFRRYFADDPVAVYGITHLDEVFSDRRVIDPDILHASGMHRDIRKPADMEYLLTSFLTDGTQDWSGICFFRKENQQPFNKDEEQTLALYVPHLRRSTYIHKTIAGSSHSNTIQNAVLDHLDTGIIVVDENHEVVICNKNAQATIKNTGVLTLVGSHLTCHHSRDNSLFHRSIEAALHPAVDQPEDRRIAVRLRRLDSLKSILAVATQLQIQKLEVKQTMPSISKAHYTARIPTRKNILITLCDPEDYKNKPAEMLAQLFNLTQAEAALVDCLADDCSLDAACKKLGRAISTAKTQLRSIFQKTDTNRQSSLIRLIMSIP